MQKLMKFLFENINEIGKPPAENKEKNITEETKFLNRNERGVLPRILKILKE